jgi:trehalose-6-phosphatase
MAELRDAARAASVLFVGDDVTDEDVFAVLGDSDWSVRVGPGETSARHRLADPGAVQQFVRRLTNQLTSRVG